MLWRRVIVLHAHAGEGHRHLRLADLLPSVLFHLVDGDDAPLDRRRERKYSEQHVARQLRAVLVLQKGVASRMAMASISFTARFRPSGSQQASMQSLTKPKAPWPAFRWTIEVALERGSARAADGRLSRAS